MQLGHILMIALDYRPNSDFWPLRLQENKFVLFRATKCVLTYYSTKREHILQTEKLNMLPKVTDEWQTWA